MVIQPFTVVLWDENLLERCRFDRIRIPKNIDSQIGTKRQYRYAVHGINKNIAIYIRNFINL
jgi:hypothetical protein